MTITDQFTPDQESATWEAREWVAWHAGYDVDDLTPRQVWRYVATSYSGGVRAFLVAIHAPAEHPCQVAA